MHHKNILFVAETRRCVPIMRELKQALDVSILSSASATLPQALNSEHVFDCIIIYMQDIQNDVYTRIDAYIAEHPTVGTLVVQDKNALNKLRFFNNTKNDFIVSDASAHEFQARCALLMWNGGEEAPDDEISIDNMTINLATYQVYIDDKPVDLTLMEYSLLSFLASHPGRAYSREKLLHQVWGFEYCGGTRTVDVHIRRVRSKVGPQVASHIGTVRGVGYLFRA